MQDADGWRRRMAAPGEMTVPPSAALLAVLEKFSDVTRELDARLADAERMIVMLRERVCVLENGKGARAI